MKTFKIQFVKNVQGSHSGKIFQIINLEIVRKAEDEKTALENIKKEILDTAVRNCEVEHILKQHELRAIELL